MPNLHQIKSEQTRERLMDAALDVMQTKGLASLSMHEVARIAGMTTGAVQHHFPSKAALMLQIIERLVQQIDTDDSFWPVPHWPLQRRADHFVQQAWLRLYGQPRFAVAWEAYLAVRADAAMVAHIQAARAPINDKLLLRMLRSFPEWAGAPAAEARFQLVLSCLRGLGVLAPFSSPAAMDRQLQQLSVLLQSFSSEVTP
ncbi:TetR/AcrR family transcriptional regulator [Comamonas sp. MYb396]|uniref:TetR/AcrR family transcriptional regulator n=1 Tax=Comamonas sp. MYb396 TaxID=2745302 RepID=UPI00309D9773